MRIQSILLSLSAVAALSAGMAQASTNLVTNGNFESTTNGTNKQLSSVITLDAHRTTLTGWTSSNGNDGGYNFVLSSGLANTWDSAIWLKNSYTSSANGGNIFASDALYYPGTLSQSISGLTVGGKYTLTSITRWVSRSVSMAPTAITTGRLAWAAAPRTPRR